MSEVKYIIGNWKMNGLLADSSERVESLVACVKANAEMPYQMVLCPPATLLSIVSGMVKDSAVKFGGQDCHSNTSGAFTGDIAAEMLKDIGADYVIVGHSERREYHNEKSEMVAKKAKAAHEAGLIAVICIGEQGSDRDAGKENDIVGEQLESSIPETANANNTIIAYEPVWAIGTGKTASNDDVKAMHSFIRSKLEGLLKDGADVAILYGGSVKPANAKDILHIEHVNGVLVGGASLKAEDFCEIAKASV